ncbi:MAG: hypothetical protein U5L98_13110 [Halomonas sp.]|uniref:hypothetical protein n=1 Tax=Halomonas sp. TaxID=1486246 RepID=UPI002ACE1890|nr:hypothetical protein [Halomonas sp.]MDZ7853547.1 hypothetical protein [Halomonas sp.]
MPEPQPLGAVEEEDFKQRARSNSPSRHHQTEFEAQRALTSPPHHANKASGEQVRTLKILMISGVYLPRVSGASTFLISFCSVLERLGHSVTLIYPAIQWVRRTGRWYPRIGSATEALVFASRTETQKLMLLEALALGTPRNGTRTFRRQG